VAILMATQVGLAVKPANKKIKKKKDKNTNS
jgi:hypothetical protein